MTPFRYAVVGVGHLGKEHARIAASLPGVELVGVVDANPEQAKSIAEKHGTKAFAQPADLIGRIDAASIVVPTTLHGDVSEAFLQRGIPLLIEKPIASNLTVANRLVNLAEKHGATVHVGHIERFNPAFEEIAARSLSPRLIRCQRVGPFTGRAYDVGVVLDLMIHDLDLILSLVKSPVRSVDATGMCLFGPNEDIASARVYFANGCVAEILASRASAAPARTMQIWSADGIADIDFAQRKVSLATMSDDVRRNGLNPNRLDAASRGKIRDELFTKYLPMTTIDGQAKDQLTAELSHFIDCVRTGTTPRVTAAAGRDALAVAERIVSSMRVQRHDSAETPSGPHRLPFVPGLAEDNRRAA